MNAWAKLVQKTYRSNKHKAGYKLKHAMKDSKKLYKTLKHGGEVTSEKNNKSRKSKKSRKNRK